MSAHIIIDLPDGRTACADWESPIVPVMRRVLNKLGDGKPGSPADYEKVAAWLDENWEQSGRCRAGLAPGKSCEHD